MSNLVSIQLILKGNINDRLYLGYQKTAYDPVKNIYSLVFHWAKEPQAWEISNFNADATHFSCPIETLPNHEYSTNYLQPDMSDKGPYTPNLQLENKFQLEFELMNRNDKNYQISINSNTPASAPVGMYGFLGINIDDSVENGFIQFLKPSPRTITSCWKLEQM